MSIRTSAVVGALAGAAAALVLGLGAVAFGLRERPLEDTRIHDYLLAHPQVLMAMSEKLQKQQQRHQEETRQGAVLKLGAKAFFDPHFAFIFGPKNARNTFVEFFDYNCPYCRASVPVVRKFMVAHLKDARFAFIEFPIKGRESVLASRAAIAARNQPDKYLDFHFRLMSELNFVSENVLFDDAKKAGLDVERLKADMQRPTVDMAISAAHSLAEAANIDGTPAFIVNGRLREGVLNDKLLARLLREGRSPKRDRYAAR